MTLTKRNSIVAAVILMSAGLLAGPLASTASAETATDLKCRKCVGKKDLGNKSVTKKKIRDDAVTTQKLRDNAVTTGKIGPNAVRPDNLHGTAKPAGVDFAEPQSFIHVPDALTSIASTAVTAPTSGYVVVMASWFYSASDGAAVTSCILGTQPDSNDGLYRPGNANGVADYKESASIITTIPVEAGETTFHLNCYDVGTDMRMQYLTFTALFVPARY
jgi:hypothetical protein